jgi:hypothetical protein
MVSGSQIKSTTIRLPEQGVKSGKGGGITRIRAREAYSKKGESIVGMEEG